MFKNIFFVISVKICLSEFNITLRIEMYVYRKKVLILLENPRSQRIARTTHASMNVEKRGALVHLRQERHKPQEIAPSGHRLREVDQPANDCVFRISFA